MGDEHAATPTQAPPRERMSWTQLGEASRELARAIVDDGYEPDLILGIARGGLPVAGAGCASETATCGAMASAKRSTGSSPSAASTPASR